MRRMEIDRKRALRDSMMKKEKPAKKAKAKKKEESKDEKEGLLKKAKKIVKKD